MRKEKNSDKTAIYGVSGREAPPSKRRVRVNFAEQPSRVQIGEKIKGDAEIADQSCGGQNRSRSARECLWPCQNIFARKTLK
jgi:hypothetical protein